MSRELPSHAHVVVIGAGVAGCSVAYHLTKMGWYDVVLLERQTLASGTSGFAAGLVTQLRASRALTEISRYAVQLYAEMEKGPGQKPGFKQTGNVSVARVPDRMAVYRRIVSLGHAFGVELQEVSPAEIGEMLPLLHTDDLSGGYHVAMDGQTTPPTPP